MSSTIFFVLTIMVLPENAIVIYNDSPWKDWPCKVCASFVIRLAHVLNVPQIQAVQESETIVQWVFEKNVIEKKLPGEFP